MSKFDRNMPGVVNGGFTIAFADDGGSMVEITTPTGQVLKIWAANPETERPVVYGWETRKRADTLNEPDWMINC